MKLSFFISYSRRDEHLVYRYADDIKKHLNVTTWLDKDDIPTGADWWEGICDGIRDCDFFMFFLSPHSAKSTYCMAELNYAHALNKVVLPIMIAETDPLPDIIDENRINYYTLTNYKDSRDVLLSLSKDIFHHLTNPRTMTDILPPSNPDDDSDNEPRTPKAKPIGNSRKQFKQANDAMVAGELAQARDLFKQVTQGRNKVLARKAEKLLERVQWLMILHSASHALTEILNALDDGFITPLEAKEEYAEFLYGYKEFGYPPKLDDVQGKTYQIAYKKIVKAHYKGAKELELVNIDLVYVPPEIGLLSKVTKLSLRDNLLTSVPMWIGDLSQLMTLHLNNNQLTSLPESIGNLSQLEELILSGNQLTNLPESIGNLSQLAWFYLESNPLESLPESIGNLFQLTSLDLSHNPLESLPKSIGLLPKLQKLRTRGSPLTDLPDHVERTDEAILAWLQDEARKL